MEMKCSSFNLALGSFLSVRIGDENNKKYDFNYLKSKIELFYLNSTLNFGIPTVLVFQIEVYYKVDRLLTGLTAQQKGTAARWYSNKTSLHDVKF